MPEGRLFWWWDDAVREAVTEARETGRRQAVRAFSGMWRLAPADVEVCS